MLGRLKIDDDQLAPSALGGKGQVTTGSDLQGCAQRDGQVRVPGTRRWVELSTSARVSAALVLPPTLPSETLGGQAVLNPVPAASFLQEPPPHPVGRN